jgi:hypothetical protein
MKATGINRGLSELFEVREFQSNFHLKRDELRIRYGAKTNPTS